MRALLARLLPDRRAIAAVEFALMLPVLVAFSAGTMEFSRLILLVQKLQSGSFILADLTARDRTLSEDQLDNIFLAIDNVVQPFDFPAGGRAVVSSIGVNSSNHAVVNWQRAGSGSFPAVSVIGEEGAAATLPNGLEISAGETVIAAEVFFQFTPLFQIWLDPKVIHRISFYKPRLGTLDTILP